MDSGISRSHPDLHVVGGASFVPGIDDWDDVDDGHGTRCAGIVGARRNRAGVVGVAPGCDLYALKVSTGGRANTDWILAAMVWAAREGLDIVSHSMWDDDGASTPDEEPWLDVGRGAELLVSSGCLVVGIAGNSGSFLNPWVTNPARADSLIAVGSVDRNSDWSPFSSYGPSTLGLLQGVELVAPGSRIRSTDLGGGYATDSGTSYACPHVSGAAALLKQLHPSWSPQELRLRLHQTATDLPTIGRDVKTGWGLLDCFRAVTDPGIPGHVYNQLSGTVASVSREGNANVIKFTGTASLRDWESGRTVDDPVFVLSPPASQTDTALLANSIGRTLTLFGLILDDASDPNRFRTDQLASLELG